MLSLPVEPVPVPVPVPQRYTKKFLLLRDLIKNRNKKDQHLKKIIKC